MVDGRSESDMGKIKSLIKTSALATGILHCANKLVESNLTAIVNTKSSGKYYHWSHGTVYYRVIGQGKPLLLIHDLTAFSSSYEWTQVIDQLASNHTVYVPDLIGCGKSDKPGIVYTNYFYVQTIQGFVKDVIGEKTDVIANGLSSSFVLMANTAEKDLFGDIIMINPKSIKYLKATPDQKSKFLVKLFQLPVIGKSLYYLAASKNNIDYYLTETCFYSPFKATPAILKAYYTAAHTSLGNGKMLFASLLGNYLNIDISRALEKAENRIFLISGEQMENRQTIESSYLKLNKNIICLSVPKTKNLPQLEEPEQTLYLLRSI